MSEQQYLDEIARLQEQIEAEDPSAVQAEAHEAQMRASVIERIATEREEQEQKLIRDYSIDIRRLQEAIIRYEKSHNVDRSATERRLEVATLELIQLCHVQRQDIMSNISTMRETIAATAEELRVGYRLKKPDRQVFFPKRVQSFERVIARAEAVAKDEEIVELEQVNREALAEVQQYQEELANLQHIHSEAATELTLQQKDNKRKIESLRAQIHRTRNVARSQRQQCDDLRRGNAAIVAGCVVMFTQVNSKYYGICGGPKSILLKERRHRKESRRQLHLLEQAAQSEVAQNGEASPQSTNGVQVTG